MAKAKPKTKTKPRLKSGLLPLLILAVVLIFLAMTAISPSADVRRSTRSRTSTTTNGAPSISSISPSSGKIGDTIAIRGRGFQPGTTTVYFGNGVVTNYLANSNDTILNIYVPDTVCKPPVGSSCKGIEIKPGRYNVYVTDLQGRKSNTVTFTVKR